MLEPRQPIGPMTRVRGIGPQWDDLRDRPVSLEDEDSAARPDVREVAREIVLELSDASTLHMAKIARTSWQRNPARSTTPGGDVNLLVG
jgi:hypothetical protein